MSKFIGKYDTICSIYDDFTACNDPNMYVFQEDYGFLRNDMTMVVSPMSTLTDGASIPSIAQFFIGSPLSGDNKFWSAQHDSGYKNTVIVIKCRSLIEKGMSPEHILKHWRNFKNEALFIHRNDLPRKWWDQNLVQAMECWDEPWLKQKIVYAGVRLGGWRHFKPNVKKEY